MAARAALLLITLYQRVLSPLLPRSCRFEPSCSQYAAEAIRHFGFSRGLLKSICRISKCHPLHPGGYDPVN